MTESTSKTVSLKKDSLSKIKQLEARIKELEKAKGVDVNNAEPEKIKELDFTYNSRTYQSWVHNGFRVPDEVDGQERQTYNPRG